MVSRFDLLSRQPLLLIFALYQFSMGLLLALSPSWFLRLTSFHDRYDRIKDHGGPWPHMVGVALMIQGIPYVITYLLKYDMMYRSIIFSRLVGVAFYALVVFVLRHASFTLVLTLGVFEIFWCFLALFMILYKNGYFGARNNSNGHSFGKSSSNSSPTTTSKSTSTSSAAAVGGEPLPKKIQLSNVKPLSSTFRWLSSVVTLVEALGCLLLPNLWCTVLGQRSPPLVELYIRWYGFLQLLTLFFVYGQARSKNCHMILYAHELLGRVIWVCSSVGVMFAGYLLPSAPFAALVAFNNVMIIWAFWEMKNNIMDPSVLVDYDK